MDPEIRSFWDRARSELRAVDPAPAVEPAPDQEYGPFAVHLVTLSSFEGRRIRGR